jgi:hypothetical protein
VIHEADVDANTASKSVSKHFTEILASHAGIPH